MVTMAIYHGVITEKDKLDFNKEYLPDLEECPEPIKSFRLNGLSEPGIRKLILGNHLEQVLSKSDLKTKAFTSDMIKIYQKVTQPKNSSTPNPLQQETSEESEYYSDSDKSQIVVKRRKPKKEKEQSRINLDSIVWDRIITDFNPKKQPLERWLRYLKIRIRAYKLTNYDACQLLSCKLTPELVDNVCRHFKTDGLEDLDHQEIMSYLN